MSQALALNNDPVKFAQSLNQGKDLAPLSKMSQYQDILTVPAIRWHRFRNTNGFNEKVCRQFGRKILIHLPSFFAWIEEGFQPTQAIR